MAGMTQSSRFPWPSVLIVLILLLSAGIVVPVTDAELVLDSSFSVDPGVTYGPYDEGTVFHPRVIGLSVLEGEIIAEGGAILLTVNGHYTDELKEILIIGPFEFEIRNAHEQYTFIFNNTGGSARVSIQLRVEEVWTRSLAFISPLATILEIGGGFLLIAGIVIASIGRLRLRKNDSMTGSA
ncbi:MAG: hypothetical protein ACXADF_07415 [Candidatus Thorarchaeota archaeon]|jgi:hypothetical protein